jgi:hypothetical protein
LTLIVPLVVIGIEPEQWIIDAYPPEAEAPMVSAAVINAARKRRGVPPVPEGIEDDENSLSLDDLETIVSRVA